MCVCVICERVEWCCVVRLYSLLFVFVCGCCLMCVCVVCGVLCDDVGACCCPIVFCLCVVFVCFCVVCA